MEDVMTQDDQAQETAQETTDAAVEDVLSRLEGGSQEDPELGDGTDDDDIPEC
jgi:hypothetical protein